MDKPTGRIHHVAALDLDGLEPYRTLRRPLAHAQQGIFVAEGDKVVCRLLDSPLEVLSLLLTSEWLERLQSSGKMQGREDVDVFLAERDLLKEIVGFNIHQGIMAVGRVPAAMPLDDLPSPHLLVALDGLRISENVGVIVRNCAAFGVDAVIVAETSCSPYVRRAVRNSMGAVFRMPVVHVTSLVDELRGLQRRLHTRIVAADPHGPATIFEIELAGNVCIVLGSEDTGVSLDVAALATVRAAIPMFTRTDSLNVASASAVFLYEAARQHGTSRASRLPTGKDRRT